MKPKYKILLHLAWFLLLSITGCKSTLSVNADIKDEPIEPVSLSRYANVQRRNSVYQDSSLAIGLSISGGGSRAEYYGLGVLMGLEEILLPKDSLAHAQNPNANRRNFLNDVDYFSTVSGGGFAAGYYLGARKNGLIEPGQSLHDFWLTKSSLYKTNIPYNAVVSNLIFWKYKRYEKDKKRPSFPDMIDKEILQKGNKDLSNRVIGSLNLRDFFTEKGGQATMPMFVANGTFYNNSERVPFMPHIINNLSIIQSKMGVENLKVGQMYNDGYSFPLKYAIAASSGFPGIVPQVKLEVFNHKEQQQGDPDLHEYYLRIIDGGVVDNLGHTTLIELLKHDSVKPANKRALIIDCSGEGLVERYADNKLGKIDLLKHSLMFTLQSKYKTFVQDIENNMLDAKIPNSTNKKNYLKIGITDLRATAQQIRGKADSVPMRVQDLGDSIKVIEKKRRKSDSDLEELARLKVRMNNFKAAGLVTDGDLKSSQLLDSLRERAGDRVSDKEKQKRWLRFYSIFEEMLNKRIKDYGLVLDQGAGHNKMDLLKSADFAKFTENDRPMLLLLYELASLVETNVRIPSDKHRSILILAGRYTVYLRKKAILKLYQS
jgi:predicted acylesterase/phospholipase RssA